MQTVHRSLVFLALLTAASAGGPNLALAQDASPSEMAAARELFTEGIAAAREERWEEARGLFERSFRVVPRSSTLLNLAGAQAETGRLVQSAESYRRFIANAGPRERSLVASAEDALVDVRSRLARTIIAVEGLERDDEVWLDDEVIRHGSLGVALPVNPGDHVVTVARGGAPAGEASFSIAEGETTEVVVRAELLAPPPVDPILAPDAPIEEESGSIWTSPWLWLSVGLAVAAAVIIPVAIVTGSSTNEAYVGTLGAGTLPFD